MTRKCDGRRIGSCGVIVGERQADVKRRSKPLTTLDPYFATVLLNNAVDHRQSHPHPLPDVARSEEWLEHARQVFWRNAGTGVFDCEHNAFMFGSGAEAQLARLVGQT